MAMKNQTRRLAACMAVPEPTASPHVPNPKETKTKEKQIALCRR
jgi:hypothetical protein